MTAGAKAVPSSATTLPDGVPASIAAAESTLSPAQQATPVVGLKLSNLTFTLIFPNGPAYDPSVLLLVVVDVIGSRVPPLWLGVGTGTAPTFSWKIEPSGSISVSIHDLATNDIVALETAREILARAVAERYVPTLTFFRTLAGLRAGCHDCASLGLGPLGGGGGQTASVFFFFLRNTGTAAPRPHPAKQLQPQLRRGVPVPVL